MKLPPIIKSEPKGEPKPSLISKGEPKQTLITDWMAPRGSQAKATATGPPLRKTAASWPKSQLAPPPKSEKAAATTASPADLIEQMRQVIAQEIAPVRAELGPM